MTSGIKGSARHGTMSGYARHVKLREPVCGPCRQHQQEWYQARRLREKSDYRLSMAEAFAELGLPTNWIPAEATR